MFRGLRTVSMRRMSGFTYLTNCSFKLLFKTFTSNIYSRTWFVISLWTVCIFQSCTWTQICERLLAEAQKKEKSIFFSVFGSFLSAGEDPNAPENANCHTSISKQRPGGSEDGCQEDFFFTLKAAWVVILFFCFGVSVECPSATLSTTLTGFDSSQITVYCCSYFLWRTRSRTVWFTSCCQWNLHIGRHSSHDICSVSPHATSVKPTAWLGVDAAPGRGRGLLWSAEADVGSWVGKSDGFLSSRLASLQQLRIIFTAPSPSTSSPHNAECYLPAPGCPAAT